MMNVKSAVCVGSALCLAIGGSAISHASAPRRIGYQGRLTAAGSAYTGTALFKFAIVSSDRSLWSNDGTSVGGREPQSSVALTVNNGLFSVNLGDPGLSMAPVLAESLGSTGEALLRIWVKTDAAFEQLSDQALASTPFALVAENALVADSVRTGGGSGGGWEADGADLYRLSGKVGIGTVPTLSSALHLHGNAATVALEGTDHCYLEFYPGGAAAHRKGIFGFADPSTHDVALRNEFSDGSLLMDGQHTIVSGRYGDEVMRIREELHGNELIIGTDPNMPGFLRLRPTVGSGLAVTGNNDNVGVFVRASDGNVGVGTTDPTKKLTVYETFGGPRYLGQFTKAGRGPGYIGLDGGTGGGRTYFAFDSDQFTIYTSNNAQTSWYHLGIDGGNGRVSFNGTMVTDVLEITGGDLVERFNTGRTLCAPGSVVVIDEEAPGQLKLAVAPYDRRVAGVVSGAGGIAAGICMGRARQLDGDTPVAMTGRVYVKCTTESGRIRPGDMLTTSSAPGEAMRVTDFERAHGATIGKAMTSLERGHGLVLVLVALQ